MIDECLIARLCSARAAHWIGLNGLGWGHCCCLCQRRLCYCFIRCLRELRLRNWREESLGGLVVGRRRFGYVGVFSLFGRWKVGLGTLVIEVYMGHMLVF